MADRSTKKVSAKRKTANTKRTDSVMAEVVSTRSARRTKKSKTNAKNTAREKLGKKPIKKEDQGKSRREEAPAKDTGRRAEYASRNPDQPSAVQLNDLRSYVKEIIEKGVNGLLEEYETTKKYNIDPMLNKNHLANPTRNRYKDIFCIDPTRVVLEGEGNNYIHANYVKGEPFINDFICTQGPLESTLEDFWKMIAQENVGYIIMLCDLTEQGKKKCERYIPEKVDEEKTFGEIKVKLLECNSVDPQFIMSNLLMEAPGASRVIFHYQWKEWPDHGVPVTTNAALRALSAIRGSTFTAIVHCSAGVGRTGTLVAVEWVLQTIMKGEKVDMKKMLREIRNQRAHAIQTNMQYVYVAQCALRLWTKVDKEKLDPNLSNDDVFLKFTSDMKAANPQAYNPK